MENNYPMYDFALHQNTNNFNKYKNAKNIFPYPQKLYWLNNSAVKNDVIETDNKKQKNKSKLLFTLAIGLIFLSKGVQKKSRNFLETVKENLEIKMDKSIFNNSEHKTSFYEYSIRKISSFIRKSESINNFNSLKDILFMRFMYKTTPTKKIHQGISKIFEYLSRKTITKSYKKTQKYFNEMFKNFDKLDDYILKNHGDEEIEFISKEYDNEKKIIIYKKEKKTKKSLVLEAKGIRETVEMVVNSFIHPETQKTRYNFMKKTTSKLYEDFWNESFKGFWTKNNKFKRKEMWQTFIASEQIKLNKTDLAEKASVARNMLTYNDSEKKLYISEYLDNLSSIIPFEDNKGTDIIKRLKWYIKDTTSLEDNKYNFLKEIEKLKKHNIKTSTNENIAKIQLNDKERNIKLIEEITQDYYEGEMTGMLNIYRQIAPFELSKSGTLSSMKKAVTSFDRSFRLEMGEMFDKLRDLEIGSAPTDILTIFISSAMILRALEKSNNKEERKSIMLKSGIPIVGAISVSLISATKLISGSKSIALGFISGIILNRIGTNLAKRKQ